MVQQDASDDEEAQGGYSRRQLFAWTGGISGGLALGGLVLSQFVSPWRVTGCDPAGDPPRIDTSAHFDTTWTGRVYRTAGNTATDYDLAGQPFPDDPAELLVHVHGWRNGRACGVDRIEATAATYRQAGYDHHITGLTWDAGYAWWNAKEIATRNGAKLAAFLADYAADNPATTIRLQAHSLGSRVIAEALRDLHADGATDVVTSAIFLGAAIPADSVATGGRYGPAIAATVDHAENFWMEDDDVLGRLFGLLEPDAALGTYGCRGQQPANYVDHELALDIDHGDYYRNAAVIERVLGTFGNRD